MISNVCSSLGGEKRDKFAGFAMKNVKKLAGIERNCGWKNAEIGREMRGNLAGAAWEFGPQKRVASDWLLNIVSTQRAQ